MEVVGLLAVLVVVMLWEAGSPQFAYPVSFFKTTLRNLTIGSFNYLLSLLTVAAGYAYVFSQPLDTSFFAQRPAAPAWLVWLLSVVVLDLYIYLWHRFAMHGSKWGYRLHRLHHREKYMNSTTAFRFDPLEIILSQLPRIGLIWLLGIPAEAVALYYILFTSANILQHSNIRVHQHLDMLVSPLIITPNLHRLHHEAGRSRVVNFGTVFSIWDTLLGSREYRRRLTRINFGP